jgi:tRNA nucleotidyltransferase/poly(A) polymerase
MTDAPPSLAGSAWLERGPVRAIFAALSLPGEEVRVVGGAVRNALMGLPVTEIDFATTATPDVVAARADAAGLKTVPTGVEHGTLTLVAGGRGFEVTTLREDIETDGRRAVVRFGRDWEADARRRDFTVNALFADASGKVYDPIGGYGDVMARRIRFIGDPDRRIAEDRLRILRLFRFQAAYGSDGMDATGLAAAIKGRNGLRDLSAERIGQEMRRIVTAPGAVAAVASMQDSGILPIVFAGIGYVAVFGRLVAFDAALGRSPDIALRLAALGARVAEDVERLTARLRLANAERDRMGAAVSAASSFDPLPDPKAARRLLYRLGVDAWTGGLRLAQAWGTRGADDAEVSGLVNLPERWTAPQFPLTGRDIIEGGARPGPAVGTLLKAVEDWWVTNDFGADEAELRRRLQEMTAAAQ